MVVLLQIQVAVAVLLRQMEVAVLHPMEAVAAVILILQSVGVAVVLQILPWTEEVVRVTVVTVMVMAGAMVLGTRAAGMAPVMVMEGVIK
jgi:hypothetical protein